MPKSSKAHGACSREEPQPKLRPATRTWQPAAAGWFSTKSGRGSTVRSYRQSANSETAEAFARRGRQEARGDDLVGVDVGRRQDDRARADDCDRVHETWFRRCGVVVRRLSQEFARIGDAAAHGRGGRRGRAREQRARADALAAFEIAVARADAVLAVVDEVAVHAEAHRAAGFAPFGAGIDEHLREARALGFALDLLRARHDERPHARAPPCVRATRSRPPRRSDRRALVQLPMKTTCTGLPASGSPGCSPMYASDFANTASPGRSGTVPLIGMTMPGLVPNVIIGSSVARIDRRPAVERCAGIGAQRRQSATAAIPVRAVRRVAADPCR